MTVRDVMKCMAEGARLVEASTRSKESKVLAQAALDMVAGAGRANKQGTLGLLAKQNSAGSITTARVQQLTNA